MRRTKGFTWLAFVVVLILALGLAMSLAACGEEETPSGTETSGGTTTETEVIKVGLNAPLSGPAAAWGLPGVEGLEIWVDFMNEKPITIGDKSYTFELVKYDSQGIGSKALQGARKLVLQDEVAFIVDLGGATSASMVPFLTEQGIPSFTLISQDLKADRPYLFAVTDNFPCYHVTDLQYIKKAHPDATKMCILSQDDEIGIAAACWAEAGAETLGIDVVYSKPFGLETTDFAPIVTAALKDNPQILNLGACYPEYQALICEQAYLQGWKGVVTSACWDFNAILAKVPKEFMEGAVSNFPYFNDPALEGKSTYAPAGGSGHTLLEFWNEWEKRYPNSSWSEITWEFSSAADIWAWAAQKAGTIEGKAVAAALESSTEVPHTMGGPGGWIGKDFFGIDHLLSPTLPITEVQDGHPVIMDWLTIRDWLAEPGNMDVLNKYLEKWNLAI